MKHYDSIVDYLQDAGFIFDGETFERAHVCIDVEDLAGKDVAYFQAKYPMLEKESASELFSIPSIENVKELIDLWLKNSKDQREYIIERAQSPKNYSQYVSYKGIKLLETKTHEFKPEKMIQGEFNFNCSPKGERGK